MVRKRIRKILSGGAVVFIVLLCTVDVSLAWQGTEVKITISGSTGVPGVTMTGLPSQNGQTVMTDQNGFYSAIVAYGWSGTVKPVKDGWQFEPASIPYQRVTGNKDNQNYVPTEITYTVSGKVTGPGGPMSGVQMQMAGLPGSAVKRAEEILLDLEGATQRVPVSADKRTKVRQLALFQSTHPAVEELRGLDVMSMSPLEALNKLHELVQKVQ